MLEVTKLSDNTTDEPNDFVKQWQTIVSGTSLVGDTVTTPPVYEYHEQTDLSERDHLIELCVETEASFPNAVAGFENARHILYEQITGKTYGRSPNIQSDGSLNYEEAFRIPKSQARPLIDNLPTGYSFNNTDKGRQMLAENDLLIQSPGGGEISIFGDLPDEIVADKDFEIVKITNSEGVEREVKIETLTEQIKHTLFHMIYENDLLQLTRDSEPSPYQQYTIDKSSVEAQKILEMIAIAPDKVDTGSLAADPIFSDYVAALEIMATASKKFGADYQPRTSEEERMAIKEKIKTHFETKRRLADGKAAILSDLKSFFEQSQNTDGQVAIPGTLASILSGYESAVQTALTTSSTPDEFVKNFMVAARGQDENIDDTLTDRLKTL